LQKALERIGKLAITVEQCEYGNYRYDCGLHGLEAAKCWAGKSIEAQEFKAML
jgi:hypothetical protein